LIQYMSEKFPTVKSIENYLVWYILNQNLLKN
jgi:hypothetical protein